MDEVNETTAAVEAVDRIEETFGQKPQKFLTDAGNNSGYVMQQMEEREVEFYAPVESNQPQSGNPAKRDDPTQAVPETEWSKLKRNSQGQLDKSCFLYSPEEDQYYCPQGHPLPFHKSKPVERRGGRVRLRAYRCGACAGCPLAKACLSDQNKGSRTITRDEYEPQRERTAARIKSLVWRDAPKMIVKTQPNTSRMPNGISYSFTSMS